MISIKIIGFKMEGKWYGRFKYKIYCRKKMVFRKKRLNKREYKYEFKVL